MGRNRCACYLSLLTEMVNTGFVRNQSNAQEFSLAFRHLSEDHLLSQRKHRGQTDARVMNSNSILVNFGVKKKHTGGQNLRAGGRTFQLRFRDHLWIYFMSSFSTTPSNIKLALSTSKNMGNSVSTCHLYLYLGPINKQCRWR